MQKLAQNIGEIVLMIFGLILFNLLMGVLVMIFGLIVLSLLMGFLVMFTEFIKWLS
jgi:hypothetical protein